MNVVDASTLGEDKKKIIEQYIANYNISSKDITKYSPSYPDRVIRNLIESEVIYSVAH